uniref:Uncharacterized protein n=1 Tax=Anguilla anguilla TaxID=7936 RepID=A0A0E9Q795_ANGAN
MVIVVAVFSRRMMCIQNVLSVAFHFSSNNVWMSASNASFLMCPGVRYVNIAHASCETQSGSNYYALGGSIPAFDHWFNGWINS